MPTSVKQLLAAANEAVPRLPPDQAKALLAKGGVLVVDVRDPNEVSQSGKLKGAVNVSRGMLEFRADPESPYHNPAFRKDQPVALYCASGGRSALSGKALKDLGYGTVYNIGAFGELTQSGLETEPASAGG
jgi:rhodanese-related sulfurtransferase